MKKVVVLLTLLGWLEAGSVASGQSGVRVNITPRQNMAGWTRVAIPPSRPLNPVSQWKLDPARGVVICEGNGGHEWLRYDHPYRNFLFEVEWKLTRVAGKTDYNSGIFVRNSQDGNVWYQAQVGSAGGGFWFGDNPEQGVLKRFVLRPMVEPNRVTPAGEWNTYKIRCVGKTLTLSVNGFQQSVYTQCNTPEGYLGLEAEGSRIEFRRLEVTVLP